jgi:hypothetical protein
VPNPGHEQFPSEPLLPVVTEDTVRNFEAGTVGSSQFIIEADEKMEEEQPVLAGALSDMINGLARDPDEGVNMAVMVPTVYTLLRMQAELARLEIDINDQPDEPLLPVVTPASLKNLQTSSTEAGRPILAPRYLRLTKEQPMLALKIHNLILGNARDGDEQAKMLLAGMATFRALEIQADIDRLNSQS